MRCRLPLLYAMIILAEGRLPRPVPTRGGGRPSEPGGEYDGADYLSPATGDTSTRPWVRAARLRALRELKGRRAALTDSAPRTRTQAALGILPFAVMGAVAAVDLLAGPRVGFLPLLSLGPALAAVSLRPAPTALVGALALAVCLPLAAYDGLLGSRPGVTALATIAGITVAGAVASAGRYRRERELADVTAVAEAAQRVLLRPVPRRIGSVRVAVRYISASPGARIGGDLYEVITAGGQAVRLIVADAQGKGLAAVQTAAVVLGAFREAAHDAPDLVEIAARIELSLERRAAAEEFVTAVLAQITDDGHAVEILNCGHPPPILLSGGAAHFIDPPEAGLPLGLAQLAVYPRKTDTVRLGPGERTLFYTDGISEARDKSGQFYPLQRCGPVLAGHDLDAALDRLGDEVIRHVGHRLQDDAAMLLIGPQPGTPPAGHWPAGVTG
jgi:Stage II sporulation protein E (SpoIIE)